MTAALVVPYDVTAVLDDANVQRWGVSYDPATCMATASSVTGQGVTTATGSISGTTLTVSGVTTGAVAPGQLVTGAGVALGTYITGPGSSGAYPVNTSQSAAPPSLTAVPPTVAVMNGSIT